MRPPALLSIIAALTLSSCATTGNLQFQGDLTPLGIPATFSYSSKNPISSK
jgi:hypothetical protein